MGGCGGVACGSAKAKQCSRFGSSSAAESIIPNMNLQKHVQTYTSTCSLCIRSPRLMLLTLYQRDRWFLLHISLITFVAVGLCRCFLQFFLA